MKAHPQLRQSAMWAGVVACITLVLLTAISTAWNVAWLGGSSAGMHAAIDDEYMLRMERGGVIFDRGELLNYSGYVGPRGVYHGSPSEWPFLGRWVLLPSASFQTADQYETGTLLTVRVPFWLLLLAVGIPTALLARTHVQATSRSQQGVCVSCGFSRTGLTPTAPCPECGTLDPSSPRRGAGM